jgi:DNA repair photolyase
MDEQLALFQGDAGEQIRDGKPVLPSDIAPDRAGKATVSIKEKAQILSRAQGFMGDYDFTLNPYSGCQFGCAYCYAAFFVNDAEKRQNWGLWVEVKANAVKELNKSRSLYGKKIYMSSVTDPYQPLEGKIGLTRSILEVLSSPSKMPRLVIQTRSPLVKRDIDLLLRLDHVRVNMTVTTDSDAVRKRFEPYCPSNDHRLEAIQAVKAAGIKICICITPMLPLEDPEKFARRLAAIGADIYVAQPFKPSNGPFAASTRTMAVDIAKEFNWTPEHYRQAVDMMRSHLPRLYEGREGFMPE